MRSVELQSEQIARDTMTCNMKKYFGCFSSSNISRDVVILALFTSIVGIVIWQSRSYWHGSSGWYCIVEKGGPVESYAVEEHTIESRQYTLLVADTPQKWQRGLMEVRGTVDICGYDGMIFTFPLATPQTFWNKNTLVDLDIYWMKSDAVVGISFLKSINTSDLTIVSSPVPVNRVVEIIVR